MNRSKKRNPVRSPKSQKKSASSKPPVEWLDDEWEKLTKFQTYYTKAKEISESGPGQEKIFHAAIQTIHDLMWSEEWFAKNTPYPFKISHWSRISLLAGLTCDYLQILALADNHDAIKTLARLTVKMTETLTQLLTAPTEAAQRNATLMAELSIKYKGACDWIEKSNAELMKNIAHELPYWPMLRFLNTAANAQSQFHRIAKELELGKDCPINVSESANYSLETPINLFVWKCLRHFQAVHDHIDRGLKYPGYGHVDGPAKSIDEAVEGIIFFQYPTQQGKIPFRPGGMIKRDDIPIYKESYRLPPLTKLTAKEWADKAVMPYVKSYFPDLRKVPELKAYRTQTGREGKRYAPVRKAIIQSLKQMARS